MFNFYVVLAGRDTAGLPSAGENSKPHHYKKSTKIEGPSENMCFNGKTVWRFQTKKEQNHYSRPFKNTQWNTRPINATIEYGPCNQEEVNRWKLKKAFRLKLLELWKTRTKKSSPDIFNFYVILAGHDMVTDAGTTSTCRRKFIASSLQT